MCLEYRIVATDLDGTLLNTDSKVSPENWDAIRIMTEKGVHVVPSSGRTLYEIPEYIRENPYVRYVSYSDGASVYDTLKKEIVVDLTIPQPKANKLFDVLDEYETDISVRHRGKSYVDADRNTPEFHTYHRMQEGYQQFVYEFDIPIQQFDQICHSLDSVEMICAYFHSEEELIACRNRLEKMGDYTVASSWPGNLEIYDKRAGKGNALLELAKYLGIDPTQTIAVGDSPNDIDMVTKAGLGLAMGNARQELKAIADQTICTNDEHAMRYIQREIIKVV